MLLRGFGEEVTVTLQDANDIVFDSLAYVTLGQVSTSGTLGAVNGLTLDFGGNITGNSLAEPITLTGYVKDVETKQWCRI